MLALWVKVRVKPGQRERFLKALKADALGAERDRSLAMGFWYVQLALNFVWSPVMFTLHAIALALVVILALLVAIFGFIIRQWPRDRVAALLFCALRRLVFYATLLNFAIWLLNSGKYPTF